MVRRRLVRPEDLLRFYEEIEPALYRYPAIDPPSFRRAVRRRCCSATCKTAVRAAYRAVVARRVRPEASRGLVGGEVSVPPAPVGAVAFPPQGDCAFSGERRRGDGIGESERADDPTRKESADVSRILRLGGMLSVGLWTSFAAVAQPQKSGCRRSSRRARARADPPLYRRRSRFSPLLWIQRLFGTQHHTITVVSRFAVPGVLQRRAASSRPRSTSTTFPAIAWIAPAAGGSALLRQLGLNSGRRGDRFHRSEHGLDHVDGRSGLRTLAFADQLGRAGPLLTGFSFPAHGFATDYAGPLGILMSRPISTACSFSTSSRRPGLVDHPVLRLRRDLVAPGRLGPAGDARRSAMSRPRTLFYRFIQALARPFRSRPAVETISLCPDAPVDARADGGFPRQGARPELAVLSPLQAAPPRAPLSGFFASVVFRARFPLSHAGARKPWAQSVGYAVS